MKLDVVTLDAGKAGSIDLSDAVFGIEEVRADILQRAVKWQLSRRQAGTHKTKERGEIARTKKKFGRQKGGGGARHGSRNAPIFVGGGVPMARAFAPMRPNCRRKCAPWRSSTPCPPKPAPSSW